VGGRYLPARKKVGLTNTCSPDGGVTFCLPHKK
jgi:hypothetical protein